MIVRCKAENRSLYTKLLLSIVLCTVVTLTLTSTIQLLFFNRIALKRAYQSDLGELMQNSREVVSLTSSAQSLSFQIYRSLNVSKLMSYADPSIYDITAAMGELQNDLRSMPFIESIYVYNPDSAHFYIAARRGRNGMIDKSEIADKEINYLLAQYRNYIPFTPIPRTMLVDPDSGELAPVYTYLCFDAIGALKAVNSAVIVNIEAQWINQNIGISADGHPDKSFIIDNWGRLLSRDGLAPDRGKEDGKLILGPIMADGGSGYYTAKLDSGKSLVSYTAPDPLGWRYVRVTPYRDITRQIYSIRMTTLWIALAILAAGLLLSWLLSRKLYVPIDRMANRMKLLEAEKRNSLYTIRQDFLRNLVLSREPINPRTLRSRMASLGISFDFQKNYRLALLTIDGFKSFSESTGSDLRVYKFAMLNIGSELLSQAYPVETVDLETDTALLILGASDSGGLIDEDYLQILLRQIQKAVKEHLKISVSVAYSPCQSQILPLYPLYKQVCEAAEYRLLLGHGCLIKADEMRVPQTREYVFPVDKEKKLIDALMSGKADEAKETYDSILKEASHYAIPVIRSVISHLLIRIVNVMHTLEKNHAVEFEQVPLWTLQSRDAFETVEEANEVMYAWIEEIKRKLADKRSARHEDLIKRISDIIDKQYANPNLSLNWVAETLGMSSSHVGRIYRQLAMKPLADAINEKRMERSAEMLLQTRDSVAEVAAKTGFTNTSYFHRMFKRHYGLTPADFRKNSSLEGRDGGSADSGDRGNAASGA